ncbi:MAG: cytochrome P450 [Acidobacteriia bacterium]|nr:cytochrome P450 [Terriglobia bacterium]
MHSAAIDISSSLFKADPYPFYAQLRAEHPVFPVRLPDGQTAWLITRYDDALSALKDRRFSKDKLNAGQKQPWIPAYFKPLARNMLDLDDPDHARLRGLVHKAFTPKIVESMRQGIESLTEKLLDAAQPCGRMDLVQDYALPLPTAIIAQMLGVPAGEQHKFHRWSSAIVSSQSSKWGTVWAIPHAIAFLRFIRKLIRLRRNHPQSDLTSALAQAEEAGDKLNEDELFSMIFLLLIAGHETTVNLIANSALALLCHPDQMERLRCDPSLIEPAVEELLRFEGPVETSTERYALEDVLISGSTIPRGALVYVVLASANRDERQFENPDRLDITRQNNRHLAFGQGIHYCLGAPLARLETQIAINALLRRSPHLQLAVPVKEVRWKKGLVLRGLESLPVRF